MPADDECRDDGLIPTARRRGVLPSFKGGAYDAPFHRSAAPSHRAEAPHGAETAVYVVVHSLFFHAPEAHHTSYCRYNFWLRGLCYGAFSSLPRIPRQHATALRV